MFWKDKSEKLGNTFFHAIKQLREDNEKLKESLVNKVGETEGEMWAVVKKIKNYYKKVNKILEDILFY